MGGPKKTPAKKGAPARSGAARQPAPPPPAPSTAGREPSTARSEGHRLLAALADTGPVIAAAVGVSRQVVAQWRSGRKVPSGPVRDRLEERFGIPARSWDAVANSAPTRVPAAPQAPAPPADEAGPPDNDLEESIREARKHAKDPGLRPEVRVRYLAELNKALITRAKMREDARQAERAREQKLTRHPRAARVFAALFDAIAEWPDALRAQQAALERLRAEEDAS